MEENKKMEMVNEEEESKEEEMVYHIKPTRLSVYERTRAQVYATGNKWAIENFEATHN